MHYYFQYSSCTTDGDFSGGKAWCSATSDLDLHLLWGICTDASNVGPGEPVQPTGPANPVEPSQPTGPTGLSGGSNGGGSNGGGSQSINIVLGMVPGGQAGLPVLVPGGSVVPINPVSPSDETLSPLKPGEYCKP